MYNIKKYVPVGLLGSLVTVYGADAESTFALKNGDRVVFYGDSITETHPTATYPEYVETFVTTRYPWLNVSYINVGWGGDTVNGGHGGEIDVRMARDVVSQRPTVVTVMLGMNDGAFRPGDASTEQRFQSGYTRLAEKLDAALPGVRVTLIQPSPYDDVTRRPSFSGGYNKVLAAYGNYVRELAGRKGWLVADLNSSLVSMLEKAKQTNPDLAMRLLPDRVHPVAAVQLVAAGVVLKAWGATDLVSEVEVDCLSGTQRSANTRVDSLVIGGDISWVQNDRALPMPIDQKDALSALALNASNFVAEWNQERLRVTGLKNQRYSLKIDNKNIDTFSREELSAGINLANYVSPMMQQARDVQELVRLHHKLHFVRWRTVQLEMSDAATVELRKAVPGMLVGLDAEEAETIRKLRAAAHPEPHKYQLIPLPDGNGQ